MELAVEAALIKAMRDNAELSAIVPADRISNEWPHKQVHLPIIALYMVGETSKAMPGYNAGLRRRVCTVVWQCSVLSSSKAQARRIVALLDKIFFPGLPDVGLCCVQRVNDNDAYELEPGRWHMPPRWQAEYQVVD